MAETTTTPTAGEISAAIPAQAGAATEQTTRIFQHPAPRAEVTAEAEPTAEAAPEVEPTAEAAPAAEPATAPATAEGAEPTAAEAPATATPRIAEEPVPVVAGFEELTNAWWAAVLGVHQVLLEDADIESVTTAFNAELRARWEYARTLHERGYQVPDYLAERAPVAPLWPKPQPPLHLSQLAKAA